MYAIAKNTAPDFSFSFLFRHADTARLPPATAPRWYRKDRQCHSEHFLLCHSERLARNPVHGCFALLSRTNWRWQTSPCCPSPCKRRGTSAPADRVRSIQRVDASLRSAWQERRCHSERQRGIHSFGITKTGWGQKQGEVALTYIAKSMPMVAIDSPQPSRRNPATNGVKKYRAPTFKPRPTPVEEPPNRLPANPIKRLSPA